MFTNSYFPNLGADLLFPNIHLTTRVRQLYSLFWCAKHIQLTTRVDQTEEEGNYLAASRDIAAGEVLPFFFILVCICFVFVFVFHSCILRDIAVGEVTLLLCLGCPTQLICLFWIVYVCQQANDKAC